MAALTLTLVSPNSPIPPMPLQNGFAFPPTLSLTEKYQPKGFDDFVGLHKIKLYLSRFALNPSTRGGHIFLGPSGTGKTSMAFTLGRAMRAELHVIPARGCDLETIQRICHSCNFVPMAGHEWHMVLVEEADRMTVAAQDALLSILDGTAAPPRTVFIFTCNDTSTLYDRFLSRNRVIDFSSYGIAKDAADRLEYIWDVETNITTPKPNFTRIVKESNNNIRAALMALEWEIGTRSPLAA